MGPWTSDLWNGKQPESQREVEAGQLPEEMGLDGEAMPPPEWSYQWLSRQNKLQAKWPPRAAVVGLVWCLPDPAQSLGYSGVGPSELRWGGAFSPKAPAQS